MKITFRFMKNTDKKTITKFMNNFYKEDVYVKDITSEKIKKTFSELEKHPEKGCILVAEHNNVLIGYALLIHYWSNEFGGNILHIDELYLQPKYRGKGIGTKYLTYIIEQNINTPVAIQLEITQNNTKGKEFYKKFGFQKSKYNRLVFEYNKK